MLSVHHYNAMACKSWSVVADRICEVGKAPVTFIVISILPMLVYLKKGCPIVCSFASVTNHVLIMDMLYLQWHT